jgi:hypothetical protein
VSEVKDKVLGSGCPLVLFIFVSVMVVFSVGDLNGAETKSALPSRFFVATYFHGTVRCTTCQQIEALSAKAIQNNFVEELKTGTLAWQEINVEKSENQHFIKDYQLFTKSLIISEMKEVRTSGHTAAPVLQKDTIKCERWWWP